MRKKQQVEDCPALKLSYTGPGLKANTKGHTDIWRKQPTIWQVIGSATNANACYPIDEYLIAEPSV
jgi:hypothetical protein